MAAPRQAATRRAAGVTSGGDEPLAGALWVALAAGVFVLTWFAVAVALFILFAIQGVPSSVSDLMGIFVLVVPAIFAIELLFFAPGLGVFLFVLASLRTTWPRRFLAILLSPLVVVLSLTVDPLDFPWWLLVPGAALYGAIVPLPPEQHRQRPSPTEVQP